MAKQSGLGDNLYVGGYDLSGDIGSLGRVAGGPSTLDVTGIDKSAHERIGGLRDGGIEYTAYFNPATDRAHDRLSLLPTSDVVVTYCRGTALDSPAAVCVAKQLNYDGNRADNGAFTFGIQAQANGYGLEWGRQLTAGKRTDGSATDGASIDTAASAAFGLQAYLQVFAFAGNSVTIKIQDSADNSAWLDLASAAFSTVTGVTSERIQTGRTATVRRYLRAVSTGTFSNVVFSVVAVKNETAVAF